MTSISPFILSPYIFMNNNGNIELLIEHPVLKELELEFTPTSILYFVDDYRKEYKLNQLKDLIDILLNYTL